MTWTLAAHLPTQTPPGNTVRLRDRRLSAGSLAGASMQARALVHIRSTGGGAVGQAPHVIARLAGMSSLSPGRVMRWRQESSLRTHVGVVFPRQFRTRTRTCRPRCRRYQRSLDHTLRKYLFLFTDQLTGYITCRYCPTTLGEVDRDSFDPPSYYRPATEVEGSVNLFLSPSIKSVVDRFSKNVIVIPRLQGLRSSYNIQVPPL
ncbi:hypothetical protein H4582DRAFT_1249805 [Lactarius indigo]|nr:hypothetical protein H4582DRAFT_1249805 [Lactarius indigo]